jgi:hypothetical protein
VKKQLSWQIFLAATLIILSGVFYIIDFLIFRDAHHIFIYLIGDVAFVFLEVLLVTLVIHQLLGYREKKSMLNKLNMVIGAFFSEVGTELLKTFAAFDGEAAQITRRLVITNDWSEKDFSKMYKDVKGHNCNIDVSRGELEEIRNILKGKRHFLLNLLENPNLLEHESFTDLLWAVFHLTEELMYRKNLQGLPKADYEHLALDIERAYILLIMEWLDYMGHLKDSYPYLFSLSMRTNPFDVNASVEIK